MIMVDSPKKSGGTWAARCWLKLVACDEAGGPRSSYSAIRPSGRALVAASLDGDLDVAPPIPGGEWYRRQPGLVEADYLAAGTALEVGVATAARGPMPGGRKAPDPILAGDLVHKTLLGKPFEHAVERHAIDILATAQAALDLVMRQRLVGAKQRRQHFDAGARQARAGRRKQRCRLQRGS